MTSTSRQRVIGMEVEPAAHQKPEQREGGLGAVCARWPFQLSRPPDSPVGSERGVGRQSRSSHVAGPQGPGWLGDFPTPTQHRRPLQAQAPPWAVGEAHF